MRSLLMIPIILVIGIALGGQIPLVWTLGAALMAPVVFSVASSGRPGYRRWLAERQRRELQRGNRERRQLALESAGVLTDTLVELSALVQAVELNDEVSASRYELDGLLDHYVEVAVALKRYERLIAANGRDELVTDLLLYRDDPSAGARVRILEHRLRCHDQCVAAAKKLRAQSDAIIELLRLIAQRSAMPELPIDSDAIDRRLADVEGTEAALGELTSAALADLPRIHKLAA
jgi:hypothetical protein